MYTGVMTDRIDYDARMNRKTPVIPFRAPSRENYDQVRAAASAAGMTVSGWVRQAVARALEETMVPTAN